MAITATKSPYLLTEQGDNLATVFQGRDALDTTPVCKYKCSQIRVYCGGSGVVTLLDAPAGQVIFQGEASNAGDILATEFGEGIWFDGCYVESLPANSIVFLYVL